LVNEPLFSGGLENGSSYHGPIIGSRIDLEEPEPGSKTIDHVPRFLAEARVTP
jgi:hypothetical protein